MRYRASALCIGCVVLAFGCMVLGGCGEKSAFNVAPVAGKVTFNGKPVPYLVVIFSPIRAARRLRRGVSGRPPEPTTRARSS